MFSLYPDYTVHTVPPVTVFVHLSVSQ
jgi:hypothetical protein